MKNESSITCPVNSHNEWDPLEEVIVGTAVGAMFPAWDTINKHASSGDWEDIMREVSGGNVPYEADVIKAAMQDRDELVNILKAEGVIVRLIDGLLSILFNARLASY